MPLPLPSPPGAALEPAGERHDNQTHTASVLQDFLPVQGRFYTQYSRVLPSVGARGLLVAPRGNRGRGALSEFGPPYGCGGGLGGTREGRGR